MDRRLMATAAQARTNTAYQILLVALLGVNMGVVFLDRQAFGLLAPLIQPEFGLTNLQVGTITGILAVTWAFSSFGLARAADITGRSKLLLVAGTVVFSAASISSGLAIGFLTLLAARALMGIAEGGLPPVSTHILATEVSPQHRGLAIGMLSTIGLQLIPLLGPLMIVGIGTLWGWRHAFWIAGLPGLAMAVMIWCLVRSPQHNAPAADATRGSVIPLLKLQNIRCTMALATFNMSVVVILTGFLPLYLVNQLGMSNAMMGVVMTIQGAFMVFAGFVGPMLSDRLGRKFVIFASFALLALGAVILAVSGSSLAPVIIGTMLSGSGIGAGILIMNVIPGESAPPHLRATAMGLNAAVGELLGAGAMPVAIGWAADQIGLGILPWLLIALAALVFLVTLGLSETAPKLATAR
jgi:MFS family permease